MMQRVPGRAYDIAFFAGIILLALFMFWLSPAAHAAPLPKMKEVGCDQFAMAGNYAQFHCIDPTGFEYDTNGPGFMIPAGN